VDRRPGDDGGRRNLTLGITLHIAIGAGLGAALGNIALGSVWA
jgi:hypothetical protein